MKTFAVINPNAGSAADVERVREELERRPETVTADTTRAGHGEELARRAADEGYGCVVAVGGDGTINEVVNGVMRADHRPLLGVVPLGTGNDLARLLGLGEGPWDALAYLGAGRVASVDLFTAEAEGKTTYGINVAAGGFGGQVDGAMTSELKARWGPLAYLIGAASVLPDLKNYETYLALDDEPLERIDAVNVIVANGRTAAGGRRIAPLGNPEDGLLDVIVVRSGSMVELGEVGARLMSGGSYLDSPLVVHRRARRVRVSSAPGMWFNVDGELLTDRPLTFEILPAALRVLVGNDYRAEPPKAGG